MRRVAAGLGSLAIAAGLTTTFALSAGAAAPPDGAKVQPGQNVTDELPNPAEEKRRELREVALRKVLAGDAKVEKRGASEVVKVGKTARRAGRGRRGPVRRARAREDGQDLRRARRVRRHARSGLSGPGHGAVRPRADAVQRPAAQRAAGARPRRRQLDDLAAGLQQGALRADVLRHRRGRRVGQDVLRAPVVRALQRRRPGQRLGQGPVQRGALRAQQRLPVRGQRAARTRGT